ncbi:ABC transporter permease [Brevibacterium album]|uniref:ABC transporter permease n=1 Tax=Brevibacterium album TaxID=417948 RepID=UPI0004121EF4|nr:ABC transporter permease [Brevibacterium album]
MAREILTRLLSSLLVLWLVSVIVFMLTALIPGDPALTILGENATPEQIAEVHAQLGLDQPLVARYFQWLTAVLSGDLGQSLFSSQTVAGAIASRITPTVELILFALVLSLLIGTAVGVISSIRPRSVLDRAIQTLSSVGIAVPNFWLGAMLIAIFSISLAWLPSGDYTAFGDDPQRWARNLTLPVIALAAGGIAEIARQSRASLIDVQEMEFVRTLKAKGLDPVTIKLRHVLRSAMIPVVTVAGLQVNRLFGLSVLIEAVFRIPGIGSLLVSSVFTRDIVMVQGTVLLITCVVIAVNLVVDLSYRWLNPKTV